MTGNNSLAAKVSLLLGIGYVAIGIIGFVITGFSNFTQNTNDAIIGFQVNPAHNLVHMAIGAFLLLMSQFSAPVSEGALMGVGLFYIVAFVIGFVDTSPIQVGDKVDSLTIISMKGSGDLENFNHLFNGVIALAAGLVSSAATAAQAKRSGIPA
ncbi:MAG: hypothetical protein QOG15_2517 [Solirubrobacteraceae bacterium]|jgi:hypothetical protein|nr:hypothetical protein [Solirubrobacteraceae bacterium]